MAPKPPYRPAERSTLPIPSGPGGHHLFVVPTDPRGDGRVALVNITSLLPGRHHDPTCLLLPGDHPFVVRPSRVFYRRARIEPVDAVRLGVDSGDYMPKAPMRIPVFQRIRDGFDRSPFAVPDVADYVRARVVRP